MNWEAVGAIGQVLGSIAVFVTLGYLTLQIRSAREEVRRTVSRARVDGSRDLYVVTATNPELASALQRLSASSGSAQWGFVHHAAAMGLTEVEARQVNSFLFALWNNFEASIISIENLSAGLKQELDYRIRFNYAGSGHGAKWYHLSKDGLNPDVVSYVDKVLA